MITPTNTKSYLESAEKTAIRNLIVQHVLRASCLYPMATLKYLTLAAAEAIEANMIADAMPSLIIHAVEYNAEQMLQMVHHGPFGMVSHRSRLEDFIDRFPGGKCGEGKQFDGHFVGLNFDWYGWLTRDRILAMMSAIADHRFVKPGGTTIVPVTYQKCARKRTAADASMALALGGMPGEPEPFYSLETAALYTATALATACDGLTVRELDLREYRNREDSSMMMFMLFEISKPASAPAFPDPKSRIVTDRNGIERIGGLVLPGKDDLAELVNTNTFELKPQHLAAFAELEAKVRLKGLERELFDHAMSGKNPPRSNTPLGRKLAEFRNKPHKAVHRNVMQIIRPDYFPQGRQQDAA